MGNFDEFMMNLGDAVRRSNAKVVCLKGVNIEKDDPLFSRCSDPAHFFMFKNGYGSEQKI